MAKLPPHHYQSILTPVQSQQGLIFGVTFKNPESLLVLYKEHFYSLFLLLFYYGQQTHKQMILRKVDKCLESLSGKIKQHRNNCIFCIARASTFEQNPCLETKVNQLRVRILHYLKKQLSKNSDCKKIQLHVSHERDCIRKAYIDILQSQSSPSLKQLNFFSFTNLACALLGIQCKVKDYFSTHIIQFYCLEFLNQKLSVFIEINDDTRTYYYIKRRGDPICKNKLSSYGLKQKKQNNEGVFGQINNMGNSSFRNLLKNQISIQISPQQAIKLNQTLNQNSFDEGPEAVSKFLQDEEKSSQEISYMEESRVLQNLSKVQVDFTKKKSSQKEEIEAEPKIGMIRMNSKPLSLELVENQYQYDRCDSEYSQELEKNDEKQNFQKSMNDKAKTSQSEIKFLEQAEVNKNPTKDNFLSCEEKKEQKQSFYGVLEIGRFAKSGVIQSPKRQRPRKNSDTLNQKINMQDFQCSFNTFADNLNQNLLINQSVVFEQKLSSEGFMQQSQTKPFNSENLDENYRSCLDVPNSAVNQLVNMVKSGITSFSVAMMERYSFEEMIEAIEKLQTQQISSKLLESVQKPIQTEQKQIDFITILSAIFKEQKQHKIHEFIQNAKKAMNQLKMKQKLNPIKRGAQLIKFPLKQAQKLKIKENKQAISQIIMSSKGVSTLKPPQIVEKNLRLTKSRVLSISQYESSIEEKYSKFFSPQISKKE